MTFNCNLAKSFSTSTLIFFSYFPSLCTKEANFQTRTSEATHQNYPVLEEESPRGSEFPGCCRTLLRVAWAEPGSGPPGNWSPIINHLLVPSFRHNINSIFPLFTIHLALSINQGVLKWWQYAATKDILKSTPQTWNECHTETNKGKQSQPEGQ